MTVPSRSKLKGLGEFKIDTMDLTTGVVAGLVAVTITYYAGFLDRVILMLGPWGPTAGSIFLYSWFYTPMAVGWYLRRKWLVGFEVAWAMNLVRWFLGDPDGPILMAFGTVTAFFAIIVGSLLSRGVSDKLHWWFVYGWLGGLGDAIVFYIFFGGLTMFGGDWFAYIGGRIVLAGVGWGFFWIVARLIAARLVVAGVPRPE